jgi:hypothetical protein
MQRRFTIELLVDLEDPAQSETVRSAVQAAARHMYAALILGPFKPQVILYSDDFLIRHEQIAALDDTIQQGKDALTASGEEAQISDEMLAALRDMPGK